jgi:methyl-accepting chemotaxis protein
MDPGRSTIRQRLMLGFLSVAAIALLVGAAGYLGVSSAVSQADNISVQLKQRGRFLAQSIDLARSAQVEFKKQVQEWKDLLLRGGNDQATYDKYLQNFLNQEAATQKNLQSLRQLLVAQGIDVAAVDESIRTHSEMGAKYREALKSFTPGQQGSSGKVDSLVKGMDRPPTEAIGRIVAQVQKFDADTTGALESDFHARSARVRRLTLFGAVGGVLLAAALGFWISRWINRRLNEVARTLGVSSDQVASASSQVVQASQSLATGSSQQAASLEETSASLEELSSMTKRNSDAAVEAKDLAAKTRQAAEAGVADMVEMSEAVAAIKTSGDNIAKIIKTIDEIAFQTSILALNAAVESARAGEAGAGFAVVTEEVRNLSKRSAQAARETADKIEESIQRSEHGVAINKKVAARLGEIVDKARKVDGLIAQIAAASSEQSQGISQINTAVAQIDTVTQSTAAGAEETAATSEELNAQAEVLRSSVADLLHLAGSSREEAGFGHRAPAPARTAPAPKPRPPARTPALAAPHRA